MIHNHIIFSEYSAYRFSLGGAQGSRVWDNNGHKAIDFTSGWNVANLGWNHPEVKEAIIRQAEKNVYAPMWTLDPIQEEYAEALTRALPKELDSCIKTTGGTEAVEVSIKVARARTGRQKIIGFRETYHGQLFAAMALGFPDAYVKAIGPLVPQFVQMEFPKDTGAPEVLPNFLRELEAVLAQRDIAAIVTEPGVITGWGSMFVAPDGFLKGLREITEKYGTLLIVDEVGTGFSRSGPLFGLEYEQVVPDMICLAKGISNGGAAIGAVVGKKDVIEPAIHGTNLTSTFGWTPLACAASLAALQVHQREKTWEMAKEKGNYIMTELRAKLGNHPRVVEIRGRGMVLGIELEGTGEAAFADRVIEEAWKEGLHLVGDNVGLIQLMPPVNIDKADLEEGVAKLVDVVTKCASI